MDLQPSAENEAERRTRSKLESHREAIFTLRRKHWTYGEIAKWLNERGVNITLSSVHRYCQRAVAHRPRAGNPPPAAAGKAHSGTKPTIIQETQTKAQPAKHRFNIEDL
jgi:hypothetical protein